MSGYDRQQCIHCNKTRRNHQQGHGACPTGVLLSKGRGYSAYSIETKFRLNTHPSPLSNYVINPKTQRTNVPSRTRTVLD